MPAANAAIAVRAMGLPELLRSVSLALGLVLVSQSAYAEDLLPLDAGAREAYQAVGRVNTAGFSVSRGCSGTLIAPDLVVTAAHCVGELQGATPRYHYVAGWYRGRFAAHRRSNSVVAHPLYEIVQGTKRFSFDVAVVHLEDPIPEGLVAPIPLVPPQYEMGERAALFGYANGRPHALSGALACPTLFADTSRYLFGCEVRSGTSGGAVIVDFEGTPSLAAVIVARSGPDGNALAVPVSRWLWDIWRDAMKRAKARL